MSPRLFLHRDCIVSPLFLSLRRLDGLSGSTGAYMQDPLITIRVVIFASWRKERTSLESTASVSHPRTRSSCGLWLPFPPSSKVWTIDSSWSLQNSSLVSLGGEFGLCLLWPCGVVVACLLHTQEVPGSIPGRGSYLRQVSLH